MPIYVYRVITEPGDEGPDDTFEIMQSIHAEPLTRHPLNGKPVERMVTAPQVRTPLGNAGLANAGFTKFVKRSDGSYEREVGTQGPKSINPHGD